MDGLIVNFRQGKTTVSGNHMIIKVENTDTKEKAVKLVGKVVEWTSPAGRITKGTVAAAHGCNGAIRVIFEKGMPGQSVGKKVKILN